MKTTFLTSNQITGMAEAALASFEMTASWKAASAAAAEYAADELGVRATGAQIATAMRKAQVGWTAIVYHTKQELEVAQ
tara:strand:+ start:296 stop:532 length:237 start_codon:yes stop_codon:yes gene_type:complete